jgi:hypothetical protein
LGYLGKDIILDKDTNYIVSGLERSGTSLMMQILKAIGIPIAYDNSRQSDAHNPKGYFELENGMIINKLMNGKFNMEDYKGKFIKITSYGLKYLPQGFNYKIIYMMRNLDEVLDSMQKMSKIVESDRKENRDLLNKLNMYTLGCLTTDKRTKFVCIDYNELMSRPKQEIQKINSLLGIEVDIKKALGVIEPNLYRDRR